MHKMLMILTPDLIFTLLPGFELVLRRQSHQAVDRHAALFRFGSRFAGVLVKQVINVLERKANQGQPP
jgi:hypothetical protein